MSRLRVGTVEGLVEPPDGVTITGPTRVFGDAALCADGRVLWYRSDGWTELASGPDLLCAVDAPGGLLIGTEGAHLARVTDHGLTRVAGFDVTPGRDEWYTPWGGAPETRSLARTDDNVLLASVHVGGIPGRTTAAAPGTRPSTSRRTSTRSVPCRAGPISWSPRPPWALSLGRRRHHLAGDGRGAARHLLPRGRDRRRRGARERVRRSPRPPERALPRALESTAPFERSPTGSTATSTPTRSTRSATRSSSGPAPASSGSRPTPAPPGRSSARRPRPRHLPQPPPLTFGSRRRRFTAAELVRRRRRT